MKKILMGLVMAMASQVLADTATIDGVEWNYTNLDAGGVRLDSIQTSLLTSTQLTTPTTIGGRTVTEIGYSCFYGRDTLTAITISEGVETIYGNSFYGCSRVTTISLPSTLTKISGIFGSGWDEIHPSSILFPRGNSTFAISGGFLYSTTENTLHCLLDGVSSAVVPDGVTSIPSSIGHSATISALSIPEGVTEIGECAFWYCSSLASVSFPETLKTIGYGAFYDCYSLKHIVIPSSVTEIGSYAFGYGLSCSVEFMGGLTALASSSFYDFSGSVVFHAQAPANLTASGLTGATTVSYPKEYAAQYATVYDESKFAGYVDNSKCTVEVKSAKMRSSDPTIMDVTFRVTSDKPTVKVRALAFQDGVRDVAHAVRIKNYTDSFGSAIGDAITANEDHSFSWKVSSDFTNKIAKLTVDVLAVEESPLTFEFVTIPASDTQSELTIARNRQADVSWTEALLWAYADKNAEWTKVVTTEEYRWISSVSQRRYTTKAVNDAGTEFYSAQSEWIQSYNDDGSARNKVILTMLGYSYATEEDLTYAREKTGYSFSNGPYAVKK